MTSARLVSFVALVSFTALAGCAVEQADRSEPEPSAQAAANALGTTVREVSWSSGKTSDLSAWLTFDCSTYGSSYFLRTLEVFKEPSTNLDNFIARMEGQCAQVTTSGTTSTGDAVIFTENHRGTGERMDTFAKWLGYSSPTGFYNVMPEGVDLILNTGNDYVKNLRWGYYAWSNYAGTYSYAFSEDGYNGFDDKYASLMCEEGWIVTGVKLRHDTKNGKIRNFKVLCRQRS